jgi:hypothetical protein
MKCNLTSLESYLTLGLYIVLYIGLVSYIYISILNAYIHERNKHIFVYTRMYITITIFTFIFIDSNRDFYNYFLLCRKTKKEVKLVDLLETHQ